MKKLLSVIATGILLTLSIAGSAHAQEPGTVVRASIPFDFIVRGKTLPAGRYELMRINDEPAGLVMRNVDHNRDEVVFETDPVYVGRTTSKDELLFHRYGDTYFLSEVLTGGEDTGRELVRSHAERKLRHEMAKNRVEPETVAVVLN